MKELNEEQLMNVVGGISFSKGPETSDFYQCVAKCVKKFNASSTQYDEQCEQECRNGISK